MMTAVQVANVRTMLADLPATSVAELMGCIADELRTRLQFDAANYVTRGVATLDVVRLADRAMPATTEPTAK
jgi:hypothetical protein